MKFLFLILFFICVDISHGFSQAGSLDSSFGINGKVSTAIGQSSNAHGVALQPDGKIVVAGSSENGITVVRYYNNGSLDSSFGSDGIVVTPLLNQGGAGPVVIQPDGKIIVGGQDGYYWIIIRYQSNGSVDSSFGTDGVLSFFDDGSLFDIALQLDAKIIIAGTFYEPLPPHRHYLLLARCDSNGVMDTAFQSPTFFDGYSASVYSVAMQSDGKIITAGQTDSNGYFTPCFGIARFNIDGSPDYSFGVHGHVATRIGTYAVARGVVLQPDGKIVAAGNSGDGITYNSDNDITLARYNIDGSVDNSFGDDGIVIAHLSSTSGAGDVAIQSDGRIIAGGTALVRYNSDGSLDNGFAGDGVVDVYSRAIVIQPDGKILVVGASLDGFTLFRYLSSPDVGIIDFAIDSLPTLIYPNPIQSQTTLQYTLINEECITISLYNTQGSGVQTFIANERRTKGEHKEVLNLDGALPSGEYFFSISNGIHSQSMKIIKQ